MRWGTRQTCRMAGETPSEADLVIYGAGGMGQELADLVTAGGGSVLGFVDDDPRLQTSSVLGLPVLGDTGWLRGRNVAIALGIGSSALRKRSWEVLADGGAVEPPPLVHPTAYIGRGCRLGAGSIVGAGATLTADVAISRFVIVNAGATVSHNCRLADYSTVAPGAHIAGNVSVEEGADIGIGSCVIQGLTIGSWSIVGAGAVVIRDVEPNTTVVGCPAGVIAQRESGWQR